jgi:predicted metalloprotease
MVDWKDRPQSSNVDDRRGTRVRRGAVGGGIGLLALLLVALVSGVDPGDLLEMTEGAGTVQTERYEPTAEENRLAEFVSVILADTEETWRDLFRQSSRDYRKPTLVLFTGSVQSACGFAGAAVGPFYCPSDEQIYIDLSFYQDLAEQYGAAGDFAQAYVLAHEVGHHVQTLLGISEQVRREQTRASRAEANRLSVRLELQADCLAGVWAHHADRHRDLLERGDIEEGLRAAAAIGDDRLQRRSGGAVVPESFTHGTSEERARWFRTGWERGTLEACDTF